MFYTEKTDFLLSGFDMKCPCERSYESYEEELRDLIEANSEWELVLSCDIAGGNADLIRADKARMQKNRLRIRELKNLMKEQMSSCQKIRKETAAA